MTWLRKSIGDVLKLEVDEAVEFFKSTPSIGHPLQLLKEWDWATSPIGQPSPTLNGGHSLVVAATPEQVVKLGITTGNALAAMLAW